MPRRRSRGPKEAPELDVTTFLNLMVVLIPFLLSTAVFSRIAILELNMPTSSGGSSDKQAKLSIEVIVRKDALEIGNGRSVIARIPKVDGEYDMKTLAKRLVELKGDYPDKEDATILMEPDIEYDYLVKIMDAVRVTLIRQEGQEEVQKLALFPDISIGDAP
jgi:biopolymer transport protein ExbD